MNLETLVERACLESGYNDTDDAAAAEKFARHWDEHIWNVALWKAALVAVDIAVAPETNGDHAEGIIFLPEIIDRVVAVRNANNQILIAGQEHHYRMDYDAFAASGAPVEFHILAPAWFTWRGYQGLELAAASDASLRACVIWKDYNGQGRKTLLQSGEQILSQTTSADKTAMVVSGAGISAANGLLVRASDTYNGKPIYLSGTGEYTGGVLSGTGAQIHYDATYGWQAGALVSGNFGDYYGSNSHVATPDLVTLWLDQGDPTLPTVTAQYSTRIEVLKMFKPASTASVALNPVVTGDAAGGTLEATDTASPNYQRIRLLPMPTTAFTLKVLGKAKYEPLEFDQQEPALINCTNALLAFMRGSLKRRGGEIGAAQLEFQEANALLQQVIQIEALQAANNQRFLPDAGFGPEHGLGPMNLT